MSPPNAETPSHADLLREGGLYPIPVPLSWKLIGANGEDVLFPTVEGAFCHRILARGALLATETRPGSPPEAMTLRQYSLSGVPSTDVLEKYAKPLVDSLAQQGLRPRIVSQQTVRRVLGEQACAKLVVERNGSADDRIEIHYLVRDQATVGWELVYLLRRDNLAVWAPLIAEIDGSRPVGW
jgi:hypothetical protein